MAFFFFLPAYDIGQDERMTSIVKLSFWSKLLDINIFEQILSQDLQVKDTIITIALLTKENCRNQKINSRWRKKPFNLNYSGKEIYESAMELYDAFNKETSHGLLDMH